MALNAIVFKTGRSVMPVGDGTGPVPYGCCAWALTRHKSDSSVLERLCFQSNEHKSLMIHDTRGVCSPYIELGLL